MLYGVDPWRHLLSLKCCERSATVQLLLLLLLLTVIEVLREVGGEDPIDHVAPHFAVCGRVEPGEDLATRRP